MVKIFVGNLACSTTADELRELFEKYGKVSECDIVKNYGFVHMNNMSEAEEAIRNLNQCELHGWPMNVEMSKGRPKSTTKLHVSNLGEGVTSDVLRAKFEEFGPVVECDIVKDYAFVHMERMDDAMDAISKLDNTAFKGKLMSVQLSTSRLRTAPGMGDHTGCYVCGKHGHWSKDCPVGRNGSHCDSMRGHSSWAPPYGPPGYDRGSYGMALSPATDYIGGSAYSQASYAGGLPPPPRRLSGYEFGDRYASRAAGSYADRSSVYDRDRLYSSVDYYKYRARSYGSSYFEDRRMSYLPPPPPPASSLPKLPSSISPYDRQPLPPPSSAATAAAYYAQDHSPIRRVPVSSAGYTYERTRLSPVSTSRSPYTVPRPKDHVPRYAPY
ncbi:RNA-binding protein 4.1-like isoform X1 [Mastacembelus armatus]|uniref:RNA-binding protein 14 n=1 Tax=Mastacembelus armatus TaxID=205130 RepID=A0A3Q3RIH1_9TELE|nr:RNA-binding protein 4.1-like isoform X1 [Mastacembelus armatus]XP_026175944.1 RNA-binding protein 4.1-like isoform X1 [Mastacembelus armatus]